MRAALLDEGEACCVVGMVLRVAGDAVVLATGLSGTARYMDAVGALYPSVRWKLRGGFAGGGRPVLLPAVRVTHFEDVLFGICEPDRKPKKPKRKEQLHP
jgi:hypothetical protein